MCTCTFPTIKVHMETMYTCTCIQTCAYKYREKLGRKEFRGERLPCVRDRTRRYFTYQMTRIEEVSDDPDVRGDEGWSTCLKSPAKGKIRSDGVK